MLGTIFINTSEVFLYREDPVDDAEDVLGPSYYLLLTNFGHNAWKLSVAHTDVLRQWVADLATRKPATFVEIYGMTDRSGTRAVNYRIAAERVLQVQLKLLALGVPNAKVQHPFAKSIGEDYFEHRHERANDEFDDGRRQGGFRSVVMALTPAPVGVPTKIFRQPHARRSIAFCRYHTPRPG